MIFFKFFALCIVTSFGRARLLEIKQDPHEIAGEPSHISHTHYGDVAHSSAGGSSVEDTANVLQQELANGLRKDFSFLREALSVFSDQDGFVREGIIFCNPNSLSSDALEPVVTVPTGYHNSTSSSTPNDGFGDLLSTVQEKELCGIRNCEEGSFVNILSNRIRSLGYQTTHQDICSASVSSALASTIVPQSRTCDLTRNDEERKVRACTKDAYNNEQDFFQLNEKCYQVNEKTQCLLIKDSSGILMCAFDTREKLCHVSYDYMSNNLSSVCPEDKASENVGLEEIGVKNEVRRAIAYSVKTHGPVKTTDKVYVTGVTDGQGCRSLRQYIAAINGMTQINAFRDTGIIEAEAYWEQTIRETQSYVESYADILNDFYDTSTEIFPLIEFDEVDECPVGNVEINSFNLGLEIAPLCDNMNYDSRTVMNQMSFEAQTIVRSECFCRMGQLSSGNGRLTGETNAIDAGEIYEADDIYLIYDPLQLLSKCKDIKSLESVYHYCRSSYTETRRWKNILTDLEPNVNQIKHRGSVQSQDLIEHMRNTMPLVSSGYHPSCGRLITSSNGTHLHSNKGGNCVPFRGFHEMLYRLEYETSAFGSGKIRGNSFTKFEDGLCKIENKLQNTYFTFRQMVYQWDHNMKKSTVSTITTQPVLNNDVSEWQNYKLEQKHDANNVQDRLYWRDSGEPMCFIDWVHEITIGSTVYDAAGTTYNEPYSLFMREIEEAAFNVQVAKQSKLDTKIDHELLWSALEEELTSTEHSRINYEISKELAKHFMRIVTTDAMDPDVDSGTDEGAENSKTESPTETGWPFP